MSMVESVSRRILTTADNIAHLRWYFLIIYADLNWSFFAKRKEVKNSIIWYLSMFLQKRFESVQSFLLICTWVHPNFDLVKAFSNFDSNSVQNINVLVFWADSGENSAFPKFVTFLFLYLDLKATTAYIVDILPHGLNTFLKKIHITIYMRARFTCEFICWLEELEYFPKFLYLCECSHFL